MHEFFTWKGRLNRRPYFFRTLGLSGVGYLTFDIPEAYGIEFSCAMEILLLGIVLVATVLTMMQAIKRIHDLDNSGWWALLLLVPIINILYGLYLTFQVGTHGPNRFGPDLLQPVDSLSGETPISSIE